MTGDDQNDDQHDHSTAREAVADARREDASAQARLAAAAVCYADGRIAEETVAAPASGVPRRNRPKPGEFVADELSVMLRDQPYQLRCLLARSRRLAAGLPTVWEAFRRGDVDAEQIRVIDRVARRVTEAATLAAIDDRVVAAAQTRTPKQLATWVLRLVVWLEPEAFAERHRRALAERRVSVVQGVDGMGYVTGEVSAADAAAIDAMLAAAARSLGAEDPRTEQQRRADLFADLLLGRLTVDDDTDTEDDTDTAENNASAEDEDAAESAEDEETAAAAEDEDTAATEDTDTADDEDAEIDEAAGTAEEGDIAATEDTDATAEGEVSEDSDADSGAPAAGVLEWLEVEEIDPDTGELLGTHLQRVDGDGQPIGEPNDTLTGRRFGLPKPVRRPRKIRIGIVVPLSSLLGGNDAPAELADRSGFIPGETLRQHIAEALQANSRNANSRDANGGDEVLFTRLLTDDGGRLLDTTELGRYASARLAEAIMIRAGTCRFPTCTVPAERCDLDHHQPHPHGPTSGTNQDPFCRRHHRGKTFAWLAGIRDDYGVDWTMPDAEHYRCLDEPLPTGMAA